MSRRITSFPEALPDCSMTTKPFLVLIPVLFAAAHIAPAQDSASVDPTVSAVVTGGRWNAEGRSGYYRVIIRRGGSESTTSNLTVQWLVDPARESQPTIVRSVGIKELSGIGRLEHPQIGQFLKGWRLWIHVVDSHPAPGSESTRAVDLGPPGEAKLKSPA